jgi:hypothetical protein
VEFSNLCLAVVEFGSHAVRDNEKSNSGTSVSGALGPPVVPGKVIVADTPPKRVGIAPPARRNANRRFVRMKNEDASLPKRQLERKK